MRIHNDQELAVTREELRPLEERVAALADESAGDTHVRELTFPPLKRMANRLHEEIARYIASSAVRSGA
jgi:hypothetical protein